MQFKHPAPSRRYTRFFDSSPSVLAAPNVTLVADGIKMAATVILNDVVLGRAVDQFLRYSWPVKGHLKPTGNVLKVVFGTSTDPGNTQARFSGCSGGCVFRRRRVWDCDWQ